MEPASKALLPTRWHNSRATSPVSGWSGERPVRRGVSGTFASFEGFRAFELANRLEVGFVRRQVNSHAKRIGQLQEDDYKQVKTLRAILALILLTEPVNAALHVWARPSTGFGANYRAHRDLKWPTSYHGATRRV